MAVASDGGGPAPKSCPAIDSSLTPALISRGIKQCPNKCTYQLTILKMIHIFTKHRPNRNGSAY